MESLLTSFGEVITFLFAQVVALAAIVITEPLLLIPFAVAVVYIIVRLFNALYKQF